MISIRIACGLSFGFYLTVWTLGSVAAPFENLILAQGGDTLRLGGDSLKPTLPSGPEFTAPAVQQPAIAVNALIRPQVQQAIRAVPLQSQVTALEAEKKRLQSLAGVTDAMFYTFDVLPNLFGSVKDPNARYSPPVESDQGEMVDIHKAIFLIQKKIDEIKNGPEWAYLRYHERMRKLGVNIPGGVEAPKPGETRMWPREPDTAVIRSREPDHTAPIQMRDCNPRVEQYREWVHVQKPRGFDQRSGEALYYWGWEASTKERRVSPSGC